MAGAQRSGPSSNTSSRNRKPAWACSCARSVSPAPAPRSAWPILPTISPAMSGTRGELRPHDGESGRKRRRDAENRHPAPARRLIPKPPPHVRSFATPVLHPGRRNPGSSRCPAGIFQNTTAGAALQAQNTASSGNPAFEILTAAGGVGVSLPAQGIWTVFGGTKKVNWSGAVAPTTGDWTRGDIVFFTNPSAGGHIG